MANLPYKTRDLLWVGNSLDELSSFPDGVKKQIGFALRQVQNGEMPEIAKPLTGIKDVYEIVSIGSDNTYRVAYAIKLKMGVYVLDAFVKKSKTGRKTPPNDIKRIKQRLKQAQTADKDHGKD